MIDVLNINAYRILLTIGEYVTYSLTYFSRSTRVANLISRSRTIRSRSSISCYCGGNISPITNSKVLRILQQVMWCPLQHPIAVNHRRQAGPRECQRIGERHTKVVRAVLIRAEVSDKLRTKLVAEDAIGVRSRNKIYCEFIECFQSIRESYRLNGTIRIFIKCL